ncbi:MAG: hypothetical protein JWQ32_1965 [Marmoricola sp.]|nr:hypothetical protein [Marmoricola sp.]
MTNVTRPRGRLPARVYWFRRGLVILTLVGLVVAIAHLLGGSGSTPPQARARVTAARTTPTATSTAPVGPISGAGPGTPSATRTPPAAGLAQPTGACSASDITVTPVVGTQLAGRPVPLSLHLSGIQPACTFAVTPYSLVAKVTRNQNRIWSSQDCPSSIRTASVVVRSAAPTTVVVTWSGRGSDSTCSRATDWALPGSYSVEAAAIGSAPSTSAFTLTSPPRPVVTQTVHPKAKKTAATTQTPSTGH